MNQFNIYIILSIILSQPLKFFHVNACYCSSKCVNQISQRSGTIVQAHEMAQNDDQAMKWTLLPDPPHEADISIYPTIIPSSVNQTKPYFYNEFQNDFRGRGLYDSGAIQYYTNATVWRPTNHKYRKDKDKFTYVANQDVFTVSLRCHYNEPDIDIPLPTFDPINLDRAIVMTSNLWGHEYYHKIAEKIIPLSTARAIIQKYPDIKILVDHFDDDMKDYLSLFKISSDNVLVTATESVYQVDEVYMPYGACCGYSHAGVELAFAKWIRDEHSELYSVERSHNNIIVVDRKENGVCKLCLSNSDELVQELRKIYPNRNVIHLVAGEHNMTSILRTVSEASVFIAPHGAGLIHMVFLPPNSNIIEIHHRRELVFCFEDLATHLRFGYAGLRPIQGPGYPIGEVIDRINQMELYSNHAIK